MSVKGSGSIKKGDDKNINENVVDELPELQRYLCSRWLRLAWSRQQISQKQGVPVQAKLSNHG